VGNKSVKALITFSAPPRFVSQSATIAIFLDSKDLFFMDSILAEMNRETNEKLPFKNKA
jgi:hypothetical protein